MTLSVWKLEAELRRAARTDRPVVVGPFLGEVGFELLYWLPLVRATLARHRIDPTRVTVLTRGGAGAWYRGLAGRSVELFDLVQPEELRARIAERQRRAGDQKQRARDPLDAELVAAADCEAGALVLHPLLMYAGLRAVHAGWRPVRTLDGKLRHAELPPSDAALPELPDAYVVARFYESAAFPLARGEAVARGVVERLDVPVVVPQPAAQLDDHVPWTPPGDVHVVPLEPRTSLAVQTELVRRARALVCTAGGFSYLGPLTGTPTLALHATDDVNPVHRLVLERGFPAARYTSLPVGGSVDDALAEVLRP